MKPLPALIALSCLAGCAHGSRVSERPAEPSRRPQAIVTGFTVRFVPTFGAGIELARADLADQEVRRLLGAGWRVSGRSDDGLEVIAEPTAPVFGAAGGESAPSPWDVAYQLEADSRVSYAEPNFRSFDRVDVSSAPVGECAPGASGPSNASPATSTPDPEWSLGPKGANVLAAWPMFQGRGREPGAGVVVVQPDTGYRRHPAIWREPTSAARRLLTEVGWDFIDADSDPFDDTDDGLLQNPSHGTRTSSVVISARKSSVVEGASRWVSGVAPGTELVPVRVAHRVTLLDYLEYDMPNLVMAIRHAAGFDRNLVKRRADVITISLGGAPSRALEQAVTFAEQNGVIVLAAAGNQVREVVWPARYDTVVAVGATNVGEEPWTGSSRGKSVDTSAPGEGVWTARTRVTGDQTSNCVEPGNGTSFAVATTAGVAALWLSYHSDDPQLALLKSRRAVPWAFRELLRQAWHKPGDWDAKGYGSKYGPGIVDAAKLLSLPLPNPPEVVFGGSESECTVRLKAMMSLLDGTDGRGQERVATLFGKGSTDLCDVALVGNEVATAYVSDAEVQRAVDRALERTDVPAAMAGVREVLRKRQSSAELRRLLAGGNK